MLGLEIGIVQRRRRWFWRFWESVTVVLLLKLGKGNLEIRNWISRGVYDYFEGCRLLASSVPLKKTARFFELF